MDETKTTLSGLWAATMLVFLLGDVLRIFAGDFKPGEMGGMPATPAMWLVAAGLMLIPILMVVLALLLPQPISRWVNILAAAFFLLFNLVGLPTYPGAYDKFLLAVSLGFNAAVIWFAWGWR